jgi:hypothetical protein
MNKLLHQKISKKKKKKGHIRYHFIPTGIRSKVIPQVNEAKCYYWLWRDFRAAKLSLNRNGRKRIFFSFSFALRKVLKNICKQIIQYIAPPAMQGM